MKGPCVPQTTSVVQHPHRFSPPLSPLRSQIVLRWTWGTDRSELLLSDALLFFPDLTQKLADTMRSLGRLLLTFGIAALSAANALTSATLTDDDLRNIPSPGDDFDIKDGKLLAPILIPRVPGTEGQAKAQQHFVNFFNASLPEWELSWQNSTSKTPVTGDKDVPFANLIFRRDPPWADTGDVSRLTLVAHYDSKYTPEGFIGATDSAAPCAMLMHVARSIEEALKSKWKKMEETGEADTSLEAAVGIQILFLDGEEAFQRWTNDDSLYGAR